MTRHALAFLRTLCLHGNRTGRRRKRFSMQAVESLEIRQLLAAQIEIAADIELQKGSSVNLAVTEFAELNGSTYFVSNDFSHGTELWKTDGTPSGTIRLSDTVPGPRDSVRSSVRTAGNLVYFGSGAFVTEHRLWRTDGTPEGTFELELPQSSGATLQDFAEWKGRLLFTVTGIAGLQLFETDGTTAGTRLLRTYPTTTSIRLAEGDDDRFYFWFSGAGSTPTELWSTDGTSSAPSQIYQWPSTQYMHNSHTQMIDGRFVFTLENTRGVKELWTSDGTNNGTSRLAAGTIDTISSWPGGTLTVGGKVYFVAQNADGKPGFWVTSGTSESTINLTPPSSLPTSKFSMTSIGNDVYYLTSAGFWKTDGTVAGTTLIQSGDIADNVPVNSFTFVSSAGGKVLLTRRVGVTSEIWSYDPGNDGYQQIRHITMNPRLSISSLPLFRHTDTQRAWFIANDAASGEELWVSDGTAAGTKQVTYHQPASGHSNAAPIESLPNGDLVLGNFKRHWTLQSSTGQISSYSDTDSIIHFQNQVYGLTINTQFRGTKLIRYTSSGSELVKDLVPGAQNGTIGRIVESGGWMYWTGPGEPAGLWRSDGTRAGTTLVKSFSGSNGSGTLSRIEIVHNGLIYFSVTNANSQREIWRSDGTEQGTVLLPGSVTSSGYPWPVFTPAGDSLYFIHNNVLHITDGTSAGTRIITASSRGQSVFAIPFVPPMIFQGRVYFFGYSLDAGNRGRYLGLWRSGGSDATTQFVWSTTSSLGIKQIAAVGNKLVLLTDDGSGNIRLMSSNGTSAGTQPLQAFPAVLASPVFPVYPSDTQITNWSVVEDRVLFTVRDANTGYRAIWVSDGTETGTFPVQHNLESQLAISPETKFIKYGGGIAISAGTEDYGIEVFRIATPVTPGTAQATLRSEGTNVIVSWPAAVGAVQYDVWLTNIGSPGTPVIKQRVNSAEFTFSTSATSAAYRLWVRSVAIDGTPTGWSNAKELLLGRKPILHGLSKQSTNQWPAFQWTAETASVSHELWLTNRDTNTRRAYVQNLAEPYYKVRNSLPFGLYAVWVRSRMSNGEFGPWSDLAEFQVLAPATSITNVTFHSQLPNRPLLTWLHVTDSTGFELVVQPEGSDTVVYRASNVQGKNHTIPNLARGKYTAFVRALKGTRPINVWSAGSPLWIETAPENLGRTGNKLTWDHVPFAKAFTLELRSLATGSLVRASTQQLRGFELPLSLPSGHYTFKVRAHQSGVLTDWSDMFSFEV